MIQPEPPQPHSQATIRKKSFIIRFLELEMSKGIIIIAAALCALIAANSPIKEYYIAFLHFDISIGIGKNFTLTKSLEHWVNDALMAIFFLSVGMELKKEFLQGALSTRKQALLPVLAACGGVIIPACIFVIQNYHSAEGLRGWAIPTATDIAFALGVLSLLGPKVPAALKIFLMAVAVIDDLIAVIIIAVVYTNEIAWYPVMGAGICLIFLILLAALKIRSIIPYLFIGVVLWVEVLLSGVHASIAGAVLGLFIPLHIKNKSGKSLLETTHSALDPWVTYAILPLFAFVNAGVSLSGMSFSQLNNPILLGIALGLFLGKQIGVFSACFLAVKSGFAQKPEGATWLQCYAVAVLCGIGFTMSLFIGGLSYTDSLLITQTKLGVITGSFVSGITGFLLLRWTIKKT